MCLSLCWIQSLVQNISFITLLNKKLFNEHNRKMYNRFCRKSAFYKVDWYTINVLWYFTGNKTVWTLNHGYIEVQDQVKNGRPHENFCVTLVWKFITNVLTVLWYFKRWQNLRTDPCANFGTLRRLIESVKPKKS